MTDDEGASVKPERTPEQVQQQLQIKQQAKRLAREKGLDWKSMSPGERKELKRGARQQLRTNQA